MSRHQVPRPGSRAYSVLLQLMRCSRASKLPVLLRKVQYPRSLAEFDVIVIRSLVRQGLVVENGEMVLITNRGAGLVQPSPAPVQAVEAAAPAPGRYVPPMQPLSLKNRPNLMSMRPGSLAYRDIPSRMADARLPFKSSITATCEVKQG